MTIDEAFELIKKYNACNNETPIECCGKKCEECEHNYDENEWYQMFNQIVSWLEELKAIKDGAVFYSNRPIEDIVLEARADAIDEFVKAIEKHQTRQDSYLDPPYMEMGLDMTDVLEISEQLKENKNEQSI